MTRAGPRSDVKGGRCSTQPSEEVPMSGDGSLSVVLVHGGFVDGSGWQGVYDRLTSQGIHVDVVQNPTLSLAGDVDTTRRELDQQPGPVVLVGHSRGGAVITEAGTHAKV